jgi:hypothetical protein
MTFGADMGTIKCKTCPGTWTVSSSKTEKVIADNHAYLNPGHRVVTVWKRLEESNAY